MYDLILCLFIHFVDIHYCTFALGLLDKQRLEVISG